MNYFKNPKKFLSQYGLAPSKKLGQNFLVNPMTAQRIVNFGNYNKNDHVIEVGVGFGALTHFISEKAGKVTGIEIDSGIIAFHQEENDLADNVTLIHADILDLDFREISDNNPNSLKIIANLPYSISNPFIFKLIENRHHIDVVTVMLQKEVADRLTARPNSKDYGIPTVLLGCCAHVDKLLTLKPDEFFPRPKIDSEIIQISFSKPETTELPALLNKIVRSAFANRRKTLLNNLCTPTLLGNFQDRTKTERKNLARKAIEDAGLSPSARAESLDIEDFKRLAISFDSYNTDNE